MVCFGECRLGFSLEFVLINIQAGVSCKWTNDTQRFLLEHFDTIHDSPFQIYYSILPFCPFSSWLYECYSIKSNEVRVVKGPLAKWGKCSRTVALNSTPLAISHWDTAIAVGLRSGDIIILDAITGSCTAILSGHSYEVNSVTFSSDGKLIVSGADDKIVKLWDIQTGGIIKDFSDHKGIVWAVSISADSTIIASGSGDNTIRLWEVSTGRCYCVIGQQDSVRQVSFSTTDPQQLVGRLRCDRVLHWGINGDQVRSTYHGSYFALSLDGKQVTLCNEGAIIVQAFESRSTIATFYVANGLPKHCCFSPNGRLIAATVNKTAYVWDITSLNPHPIETFTGHTSDITALTFYSPCSLLSASDDESVKFWQIGTLSPEPVKTILDPISYPSYKVLSTTLQAKDDITITSSSDGVVRIWDIFTGFCKASFQTSATDSEHRDGQFINGRLIFAWNVVEKIHIYGTSEEELILVPNKSEIGVESLRITGDGSKIFCLGSKYIRAWSIITGEVLGEVEIIYSHYGGSLVIDGPKVWACYPQSKYWGWDFGDSGSSPVKLLGLPPSKLHPSGTLIWDWAHSKVQDVVTGRVIFQLPKTFKEPIDVQWGNQYLVFCFGPTEVLILDFSHILA